MMRRCAVRMLALTAALLLLLAGVAAFTVDGRALVKTVMILPEVLPDAPVRPLHAFTSPPRREEIVFPSEVGEEAATLYRPAGAGRYGAVILHLGVNPDPDDMTLHQLAAALARSDIVALIPRSSRLMAGNIEPEEVDALVGAFQYLQARPEVDRRRIGFAGFCVGASLSALAAADPRIANDVAFVNFFGGWADTRDLLTAMITRRQQFGVINEAWQPQEMAQQVLVRHLLTGIEDRYERFILEQTATHGVGRTAQNGVDTESFSLAGRSLYQALTAGDPAEVRKRLDQLPPEMHGRLLQLSPANVAPLIRARVFIMHDRNDTYVPFVESRRFAAAFGLNPPIVTEFSIFRHMHPSGGGDGVTLALEIGKLVRHLHGVLAEVS